MKRVLAIVRASTEKQETESQKIELFKYLRNYGFNNEEIEVIEVAGASARKKNKKYLQMLETVKSTILASGTIEAVGLWSLDRLGRVDDALIVMKNWFIEHKIQVYCKNPSFVLLNEDGTVSASAEIAFGVFAALIKTQTEELMTKLKRGKIYNSKIGKWNGGKETRFGYKVDKNGYVVPNYDKIGESLSEAETVEYIYRLYSTGEYSYDKLAVELDSRGIRQRGKVILTNFLSKLLKDKAYIGESETRKSVAIIDKELWNKVELVRSGKTVVHTKETKNVHFGTGIVKCPYCNSSYIASNSVYICLHKFKSSKKFALPINNKGKCDSPIMSIKVLDRLIWLSVGILHLDYLSTLKDRNIAQYEDEIAILQMKLSESQSKLELIQEKNSRLSFLYANLDLTLKQYDEGKAKNNSEKARLEDEVARLSERIDNTKQLIEDIRNSRNTSWFNRGTTKEEKKDIVNLHLKEIKLYWEVVEGKRLVKIVMSFKNGTERIFLYDKSQWRDFTKKIKIWNNDRWIPYAKKIEA